MEKSCGDIMQNTKFTACLLKQTVSKILLFLQIPTRLSTEMNKNPESTGRNSKPSFEGESHYRNLVRNLPHTNIYLVNHQKIILLAGGSEVQSHNRQHQNLEGKKISKIFTKKNRDIILSSVERAFEEKTTKKEINIHDDFYSFSFSPAYNEKKEIFACLILAKNISRKKLLNKRMHYLSTIIDSSDHHASIKDPGLKYIVANNSLITGSGCRDEKEFIGKTDLEIFGNYPHVIEKMQNEMMAQKLRQGEFLNFEEMFIDKSGETKFYLTKRFPIFDENKNMIATACISTEITKLRATRSKLMESEKKYKLLVENQAEGIGVTDHNEYFTYANPKADEIFGLEEGGLTGRNLHEFMTEESFKKIQEQTQKRKSGLKSSYEIGIRDNKGTEKILLVTVTPQVNDDGKITGSIGIFRDISLRKEAEHSLQQSEKKLKEINEAKNKFFSIIAHDLKNPFNSILGFCELLRLHYDEYDDDRRKTFIEQIYNSSLLSENLLENLLDWSRTQTGKIKICPKTINIRKLADESVNIVNGAANQKNIVIDNNIEIDCYHVCDSNMISTIFRNLLSNAVKFTRAGGTIVLSSEKKMDEIVYSVRDNGVGIPYEKQGKLFQLGESYMSQGTEKESGTGLGLKLCRELAELNKGKIHFQSTPGEGSAFFLSLPLT